MGTAIAAKGGEMRVGFRVEFEYPVRFTREALAPGNPDLLECLRRREPFARHKVFFVLDDAAAPRAGQAQAYLAAHKGSLTPAGPVLIASERALRRQDDCAAWLRARIGAAGLGEGSHVVAVGGEALQAAAGFAAATLRPAPRLTRLPTSALGQIAWCGRRESALAASCACLSPAFAVLNDQAWLRGLPREDLAAALTEAARLALSLDAELFHWMSERAGALREGRAEALESLVRWAGRLAAASRPALAFGEDGERTAFGRWSERVLGRLTAAPVALDCALSELLGGLAPQAASAALSLLAAAGLKLWDGRLGRGGRLLAPLEAAAREGRPVLIGAVGQSIGGLPIGRESLARAVERIRRPTGHGEARE